MLVYTGPYSSNFFATPFGGTQAQVSGPTGPMTVAWLTTILMDLITVVGMIFASLFFVKRMADLELANLHIVAKHNPSNPLLPEEATILEEANGKILLIHVDGPMSFGSAKNMVRRLEIVPGFNTFSNVVLDLSKVPAINGTAALAVEDMLNIMKAHQQHLFFVGTQPHVTKALDDLGVLEQIRPGHRFASRLEALQKASMVDQESSKDLSGTSSPNRNPPSTPLTGFIFGNKI
ncbi:MAG: STAS domain-containing protein [Nitrospirota bacterium]